MRKFLQGLALAAIATSALGMQAETVELTPWVYLNRSFTAQTPVKAELNKNDDGSYTLADFLGSGKPVTFTFDEPDWSGKTALTVTNADDDDNIVDGDEILDIFITLNDDTEATKYEDIFYYSGSGYSYVKRLALADALTKDCRYEAQLYLATDNGDYIQAVFNFGEFEAPKVVETQRVTLNGTVGSSSSQVAWDKTYEADFCLLEDGSYSIPDLLGCGKPSYFSIGTKAQDNGNYLLEFIGCDNQYTEGSSTPKRYLNYGNEHFEMSIDYKGASHKFNDVRYSRGKNSTYSQNLTYKYDYEHKAVLMLYGKIDGSADTRFDITFYYGKYEPIELLSEKPEETSIYIEVYDETADDYVEYAKPADAKVNQYSKNSKNIYEIEDFLSSGSPLAFTFEEPAEGESAYMEIKQSNEYYSGSDPYLYDWDKKSYMTIKIQKIVTDDTATATRAEGDVKYEEEEIGYVEYTPDYTYVYKNTEEEAAEKGYRYVGYMCLYGYVGDNYSDYMYPSFNFGKIEELVEEPEEPVEEPEEPIEEPEEPVITPEAEEVTLYFAVDEKDDYTYVDYEPMTTTLTKNDDGSYTFGDFLNSGKSLTFSFDEPAAGEKAELNIADTKVDGSFNYLYNNGYFTLNTKNASGEDVKYTYANYYDGKDYTYVYKYTDAEAAEYGCQYYAYFYLFVRDSANNWLYAEAECDFGEVSNGGSTSVAEINTSDDAPVEYYNLNGIRVENPTNGLYIRRQGADVKKVMIK